MYCNLPLYAIEPQSSKYSDTRAKDCKLQHKITSKTVDFVWKQVSYSILFRTDSTVSPDCLPTLLILSVFTARCYASAVLAMGLCLSVCLSVSVTSRSSTKTAKRRITQITPHDSPVTLVFWCQRSLRNSTGVTPTGRQFPPNAGGVGQNRRLSTNNRLYLENGKR